MRILKDLDQLTAHDELAPLSGHDGGLEMRVIPGIDDAGPLDAFCEGVGEDLRELGQQRPLNVFLHTRGQHDGHIENAGRASEGQRVTLHAIHVQSLDELQRAELVVDEDQGGSCSGKSLLGHCVLLVPRHAKPGPAAERMTF